MPWLDYLREINIASICLRIVLAMLVGGVLGMERGRKNRPAGFRTYTLVSLGAALVMMTNQYVFAQFGASDPVRMGAQVISGIGFLGAGTIILTGRNQVRGITTAAGLWAAACCGLAIGIGFYEGALVGSLAIFVTMVVMQRLDNRIRAKTRGVDIYLELDMQARLSSFLQYARDNGLAIEDVHIIKDKLTEGVICAMIEAEIRQKHSSQAEIDAALREAPGVLYLEIF